MATLDLEQLTSFAKRLEGRILTTLLRKKAFAVRVTQEGFEFTPVSSGQPRRHQNEYAQRVIERFNETGSLKPKDYQEITFNASYLLAIIQAYRTRPDQ